MRFGRKRLGGSPRGVIPLAGMSPNRIDDLPLARAFCAGSGLGGFNAAGAEKVFYLVSVQEQVVADDATVAAPPGGFKAHHRKTTLLSEGERFLQCCPELRR